MSEWIWFYRGSNHDLAGSSEYAQKQECDDPRPQLANKYLNVSVVLENMWLLRPKKKQVEPNTHLSRR